MTWIKDLFITEKQIQQNSNLKRNSRGYPTNAHWPKHQRPERFYGNTRLPKNLIAYES